MSWSIETVDFHGDTGQYTSIVLDTNDQPHISYLDETFGDLRYTQKVT